MEGKTKRKYLNKNQRLLLKSLEIMANGEMIHEDAVEAINEMTPQQAKDVLDKFRNTITEFENEEKWYDELYTDSSRADAKAGTVLNLLSRKIEK